MTFHSFLPSKRTYDNLHSLLLRRGERTLGIAIAMLERLARALPVDPATNVHSTVSHVPSTPPAEITRFRYRSGEDVG